MRRRGNYVSTLAPPRAEEVVPPRRAPRPRRRVDGRSALGAINVRGCRGVAAACRFEAPGCRVNEVRVDVAAAPADDEDLSSDEWMHVRTVVTDEVSLRSGDAASEHAWTRTLGVSGG